jgi:hypothetical protein
MNRQRKLTWIEKKQIEKMVFDHPFFDISGTVLSKKEAKAIIHSADARKSGVEIVAEACNKAGVPCPNSVDIHYSIIDNFKEVFAIPTLRRIGIIAVALILLVVFFTATPIGRAIAESVIQYFSTLLDDGKIIISKSDYESTLISADETSRIDDGDQDERDDIDMYIFVNSFDDFTKATGKIPFVLSLPHTEIYYIDEPEIDYLMLHSTYLTPKGEIATYQIWNAEDMSSTTLSGFTVYDADKGIYYSIEEDIDYIHCKMVLNDSVLTLSSNGDYTLNELIELLTIH